MRHSIVLTIDCTSCHAEFEHPLHETDANETTYTSTPPECPDCGATADDLSYEYEERTITIGPSENTESLQDVIDQLDSARTFLDDLSDDGWELFHTTPSKIILHHPARDETNYEFD